MNYLLTLPGVTEITSNTRLFPSLRHIAESYREVGQGYSNGMKTLRLEI